MGKLELPDSVKKDMRLAEMVALWGFNATLNYCLMIGVGRFGMAMVWMGMFLGSFFYIRYASKKIKSDLRYTLMLSMGEKAKGRWEQ